MDKFKLVTIEQLEKIVKNLPNKKGTEERISSNILKLAWQMLKEELVDIINSSLMGRCCPSGWKTSTIISIPKIDKPKKACEYRPINVLQYLKKY